MPFVKQLVDFIVKIVSTVKGKPKATDLLLAIISELPKHVIDAIAFGKISTWAQLQDGLAAFDSYTGSEPGSINLVKDLPADKEEEFMDHIKEAVRILAGCKLKVEGYYVEGA